MIFKLEAAYRGISLEVLCQGSQLISQLLPPLTPLPAVWLMTTLQLGSFIRESPHVSVSPHVCLSYGFSRTFLSLVLNRLCSDSLLTFLSLLPLSFHVSVSFITLLTFPSQLWLSRHYTSLLTVL
jgi:hypothetical protein